LNIRREISKKKSLEKTKGNFGALQLQCFRSCSREISKKKDEGEKPESTLVKNFVFLKISDAPLSFSIFRASSRCSMAAIWSGVRSLCMPPPPIPDRVDREGLISLLVSPEAKKKAELNF
jgi:hypothetical protein